MSECDILSRLVQVEVLRELSPPSLRALASYCHTLSLAKDRVVYLPGDPPALYAVLLGRVAILAQPSAGLEVELVTRRARQVFGEISLIVGRQICQARTVERSLVARVGSEVARDALRQCRAAADAMDGLVAARLVDAEARLAAMAALNVKDRLLDLLQRQGGVTDSRGKLLSDRFTHEELGRMVGANRVSVTRALDDLQREGRIVRTDKRIVLVQA